MSDRFTKTDLEKAKEATKRIRDKRAQKRMKNSRPEKKGSSITDIFKSYGKYDGKPIELQGGGMSAGQKKIAAKAPPPNVINEKDFAVLREEKKKVKPIKAVLGIAAMGLLGAKYLKDKNKKALAVPGVGAAALMEKKKKEILGKRMGGVAKYKRGSGLDLPVISSVKPAVHKTKKAQKTAVMKEQFNKQKSRMGKKPYSSMAEMRKAKGFKPGETPSDFNKRRMALEVGKKALRASTVGKIALGVGAAGVAAQQYLKSKMKKDKKMGGGMMQKPMGYREGRSISTRGGGVDSSIIGRLRDAGPFKRIPLGKSRLTDKDRKNLRDVMQKRSSRNKALQTTKSVLKTLSSVASPAAAAGSAAYKLAKKMKDKDRLTDRDIDKAKSMNNTMGSKNRPIKKDHSSRNPNPKTPKMMGGGMMQKPMGYRSGTMVKARGCKLGRTRPTKIT